MKTNEAMEMKAVKANVFERMAGAIWRWWYNAQAKRQIPYRVTYNSLRAL